LKRRLSADTRWLKAGVFEALVHDLRVVLRLAEGRTAHPTPESGARGG